MTRDLVTSRRNEKVQFVRRLARDAAARRQAGLTLLEGLKSCADHAAAGGRMTSVFVTPEAAASPEGRTVLALAPERAVLRVSDAVIDAVSDVSTAQGMVLVVPRPSLVERFPAEGRPLLLLWELQDPGNVGACWRIAEGAGCAGLVLARSEAGALADPFAPRVLRASAASALRLPACELIGDAAAACATLDGWGFRTIALSARGGQAPESADLRGSVALLLGSEGRGLPEEAESAASLRVTIPLAGRTESLNAAAAAAVVLFEAGRQVRVAALA